jgi:hypothetical protein
MARQEKEGFLARKPVPIGGTRVFRFLMEKKSGKDFSVYKPEGRAGFLPR